MPDGATADFSATGSRLSCSTIASRCRRAICSITSRATESGSLAARASAFAAHWRRCSAVGFFAIPVAYVRCLIRPLANSTVPVSGRNATVLCSNEHQPEFVLRQNSSHLLRWRCRVFSVHAASSPAELLYRRFGVPGRLHLMRIFRLVAGSFLTLLGVGFIFLTSILDALGRASAMHDLMRYVDAILDFSATHSRLMSGLVPIVLIGGGLLIIWVTLFAPYFISNLLRRPRLICSFAEDIPGCVRETEIFFAPRRTFRSKYFRVKVTTLHAAAEECSGHLISVNGPVPNSIREPAQLPFAPSDEENSLHKTIRVGVPAYLDVIAITEINQVCVATKAFSVPDRVRLYGTPTAEGTYTFTVVISAKDRPSVTRRLVLNWTGDWQTAHVHMA